MWPRLLAAVLVPPAVLVAGAYRNLVNGVSDSWREAILMGVLTYGVLLGIGTVVYLAQRGRRSD